MATPIHNLAMGDFDVAVDGAPQALAVFDAAKLPRTSFSFWIAARANSGRSIQSKRAARALAAELDPTDEIAVVAFAGHAHLFCRSPQIAPRSKMCSIAWILMRSEMEIGSNIYSALFLAAHELFSEAKNRVGPHAIVLLTDGQDSGLGLSWNPASMQPSPDSNQLAFEDVVRKLSVLDVEVFAISTENRPKGMTPAWLDAHSAATLISKISHRLEYSVVHNFSRGACAPHWWRTRFSPRSRHTQRCLSPRRRHHSRRIHSRLVSGASASSAGMAQPENFVQRSRGARRARGFIAARLIMCRARSLQTPRVRRIDHNENRALPKFRTASPESHT